MFDSRAIPEAMTLWPLYKKTNIAIRMGIVELQQQTTYLDESYCWVDPDPN